VVFPPTRVNAGGSNQDGVRPLLVRVDQHPVYFRRHPLHQGGRCRLCDPVLRFPWIPTAAGARWLDALVHRVPWDRCGVEQRYFPNVEAVQAANAAVPELGTQRPEMWYVDYVARVEGLVQG
jgi:hypothetical protein